MKNNVPEFPFFDDRFPELNRFILDLVASYEAGIIRSWDDLDEKVKAYFTTEQMESHLPGWKKMASYSDRITLVHVMCAFLSMFMLPEFKNLTPRRQQLAKWIALLHDIDKVHLPGKKDPMHAFRSGVQTANLLPRFDFPRRPHFHERIRYWSNYTEHAFVLRDGDPTPKPDNQKLPGILVGIENLFGKDTPAALITKTVLLHISLHIDPHYPTPSALTDNEIQRYINRNLLPLLKAMMLADNDGWSLFDPETRAQRSRDAMNAFEKIEGMVSA